MIVNLRKIVLTIYDLIAGGMISKNLNEIRQVNFDLDAKQKIAYQQQQFSSLWKQVNQNVSYYKDQSETITLHQLPVVNKNFINANFDLFLSSKYSRKKLKKVSTSGSTGVPFIIYHNKEKVKRQIADTLLFNEICGYNFGERLVYLRIWNDINQLNFIQKLTKNILPINTLHLSSESTQSIIDEIEKSGNTVSILSYASSLELLSQNLERMRVTSIKGKISCIITMAEALPIQTKRNLEQVFDCPVYSRYSNSENGFIAHQIPGYGENYFINNASFIVEILDINDDIPVDDGKMGRIVVTDLFNDAVPLIRYDTGDIGVRNTIKILGKDVSVIEKIEGRKLDFICDTAGKLLSPHAVDYGLRTIEEIKQFQLIQLSEFDYKLKLNAKPDTDLKKSAALAEKGVKAFLGDEAKIEIEFVEEIPLLLSGKRRIVVNEWKKEKERNQTDNVQ